MRSHPPLSAAGLAAAGRAGWLGALAGRVPGAVQKYTVAIGGQALLSGFNFALNILLVRSLVPADYGIFALAIVAGTVGIGLNSALASAPLSVYTPGLGRQAPRRALEATFSAVSVLLSLLIAAVTFALALALADQPAVALAFAGFVAAWTQRFYVRSIAFARRRPQVAFMGDALYVGTSLAGLALCWWWQGPLASVVVPLSVLGIANLGVSAVELAALGIAPRPALRRRTLARYRRIWREVRWSLLGVITTSLQDQAHSMIVTGMAGPAAFAPLAAGQVIFGPIRVALQAWQMVMRPELAVAIAARNRRAVLRTLLLSTGGLALATAAVGVAIALAWNGIHGFLYAENYAGQPMALVVAIWGAITVCGAATTASSGVLQAFKEFRILAYSTIVGSVLSILLVSLLLWLWQPAISLLGVLAAALFSFVFCFLVSLRRIRARW
jgi:O-antigen/teichoic acid export membrane protein